MTQEVSEAQVLVAWGRPLLWAHSVRSHWGMNYTDLGLPNLEVLIVVIDDGIFWAAGPDEADALERNNN